MPKRIFHSSVNNKAYSCTSTCIFNGFSIFVACHAKRSVCHSNHNSKVSYIDSLVRKNNMLCSTAAETIDYKKCEYSIVYRLRKVWWENDLHILRNALLVERNNSRSGYILHLWIVEWMHHLSHSHLSETFAYNYSPLILWVNWQMYWLIETRIKCEMNVA